MTNSEPDGQILFLRVQGRLLADMDGGGRPAAGLPSPLDSACQFLASILRRGQTVPVMNGGAMANLLPGTAEVQHCSGDKSMDPYETRYPCWHEMGWWIPEGC